MDVFSKETYEYIRLKFDFGSLSELNSLSRDGWKVISVVQCHLDSRHTHTALLERPLKLTYIDTSECVMEVRTKASGGHMFEGSRPKALGMNHVAPEYRVCERCGHSDVYLKAFNYGEIPPCKG